MSRVFHRINILKFIAEQGVVTVDDISAYLYEGGRPETIRVNLHQLKLGHARFGYIKSGVWYIKDPKDIELLRTYHPDLPNFQVRPLLLYLVPHTLEINSLRIALEKSPEARVSRWWSEAYIRALPLPQWGGRNDSKIPDAIFWRKRNDGSEEKYFLEYERSLKNRERYEEIFRSYAERDDVENKNVIYICEDEYIKSELQDIEAKMIRAGKLNSSGKCFQFVTREGFYKAYTNKPNKEGIK